MNPEEASRLYHYFVSKVKDGYEEDRVKDGKFQAMMEVALVNDGPVSLLRCFFSLVSTTAVFCHTRPNISPLRHPCRVGVFPSRIFC